jgi:hypothetical protein
MPRGEPRDVVVKLRLSAGEHERFRQSANKAGLPLAPWLRRCAEQTWALENALELQAADERRRREQRESVAEPEPEVTPARERWRRRPQMKAKRRTIGDALREADAAAGFLRAH